MLLNDESFLLNVSSIGEPNAPPCNPTSELIGDGFPKLYIEIFVHLVQKFQKIHVQLSPLEGAPPTDPCFLNLA